MIAVAKRLNELIAQKIIPFPTHCTDAGGNI
ncbi:uncharacterized protein METZ01_LOCUS35698 [marine metagenome]|uniref:Uncharacterized protein n=1 Tax=marine metagenome TaxID=408172 RepID=A0A381QV47_9ZZZZ